MKSILRKVTLALAAGALALTAASKPEGNLADKVRHQLVMLPYYNIFDSLAYRVDGNTVTLYGEVTRPVLKSDAERAVKHIEGVGLVVNGIKVLPLSPFDDRTLRATYPPISAFAPLY